MRRGAPVAIVAFRDRRYQWQRRCDARCSRASVRRTAEVFIADQHETAYRFSDHDRREYQPFNSRTVHPGKQFTHVIVAARAVMRTGPMQLRQINVFIVERHLLNRPIPQQHTRIDPASFIDQYHSGNPASEHSGHLRQQRSDCSGYACTRENHLVDAGKAGEQCKLVTQIAGHAVECACQSPVLVA